MLLDSPKQPEGIVKVWLAIFWSKPDTGQIYKEISDHAAADPAGWAESLQESDRLWLVDKVVTMALYGERVVIVDRRGPWLKVAAVSQPTAQNTLGYPGWVLAGQISFNATYLAEQLHLPQTVTSVPKAALFSDPSLTENQGPLSYQTRLPVLSESGAYFKVRLPDGGAGYLSRRESKKAAGLKYSPANIVNEARQFLDVKYLWGGTSSFGFDCSGFMFRLYQSQGITIPRDASEQARGGMPVTGEELRPGDLLFFARDKNPDKIHHVGMYIGEGLMIHSPNSKAAVRIEPFTAGVYGEEYWGARRYG